MDKNIKLKDIISDINSEKDFAQKIKVRNYIPILEKGNISRAYMFKAALMESEFIDPILKATEMEIMWRFDILFAYTNIEVDDDDKTFDNYDLLTSYGVFDYIRKRCDWDLNKMSDFLKSVMGINDMTIVTQILKAASGEEVKEAIKEFTETLKDKSLVDKLSTMLAFNDPIMKDVIEEEKAKALKKKMSEKVQADVETKK